MYIKNDYLITEYKRTSKLGKTHSYIRKKEILIFRCDSCCEIFHRDRQQMDHNRISNNVYHVCNNCDGKRFAQQKGVESRKVWDLPVSSLRSLDSF
jgi:hypothetical protein